MSHAHLDHSGYLPVLVRDGFHGQVICTKPTRDLADIMWLDTAHLLEEEARYANFHDYSKTQTSASTLHGGRRAPLHEAICAA